MPLEPGTILGDYRVIGSLGEGGMGQVYKVQNLISNRTEAMKVLLPDMSAQPQLMERFLREIQVQASLVHPNIASLYTASRLDNRLLMFMELVEGETLASLLSGGPLPVAQAVNVTTQILNALVYAHERGVVHRDIKPSNIMLATDGVAKLLDFGLAAARGDKRLTVTGNVLGSLHYMSPEQVRGESPTPASDIYSLGLTVYEMLTGRQGIEGTSDYALMTAQLQFMPEPPESVNPAVPEALSQTVLKAVAKNASARFGSALEFKAALDHYRQALAAPSLPAPRRERPALAPSPPLRATPDLSAAAPMPTPVRSAVEHVTPAPRKEDRRPSRVLIGSGAGVAVLLIGGGLMYWSRGSQGPVPPPPATQAPAEPQPSQPISSPPPPSQPVAAQPAQTAPPVPVQSRPPQQKPVEKPPPIQAETKKAAPLPSPVVPVSNPPAASPTPVTVQSQPPAAPPSPVAVQPQPQPVGAPPPAPVKTAQPQQAEEWARVSTSRDPAQVRQFLAAHPDGPFTTQASALLADLAWETARSGNAAALREFAARYPASSHTPEALERAAQLETRQAVLDVLVRFQDAVSARDLNRVRELWPGANSETVGRISELFKKSRSVTLTLRPQAEMRLVGDRAEVSCQERLVSLDGSKPRTMDSTARVRLVKSGGAWTIESIVSTPPSLSNPF